MRSFTLESERLVVVVVVVVDDDFMSVCMSTTPYQCNPTAAKLIEKACKPGDVGLHNPREINPPQLCHAHEQSPE